MLKSLSKVAELPRNSLIFPGVWCVVCGVCVCVCVCSVWCVVCGCVVWCVGVWRMVCGVSALCEHVCVFVCVCMSGGRMGGVEQRGEGTL